ncbi:MAG: uncharacterized lipoprotein YehR (DUF1307 family) [Algoriphagus sp.]|jgi:uncharacterized lipoprotein YehR (DUF1307 family)
MKKLILKSSVVVLTLLGVYFTSPSYAEEELHVCPGSGEKCEATITYKGDTVKVSSAKSPGSGSIVVK